MLGAGMTESEKHVVRTLRQAIQHTIALLDAAGLENGVCCCGDNMVGHADPMLCGHSPVDSGAYCVAQHVEYLREVIATTKNSVL